MAAGKTNVTIIEDDSIYVKVLGEKLGQNPAVFISQYASGEDCIANLATDQPKVLITDYYLNSKNANAINGSEVVKRIKETYPDLAVIVLSGRADLSTASKTSELNDSLESNPGNVKKLLSEGAFFYVMKDKNAPAKIYDIVDLLIRKVF